jgi:hypothetical protein
MHWPVSIISQRLIAAKDRLYVGADGQLYAFIFQDCADEPTLGMARASGLNERHGNSCGSFTPLSGSTPLRRAWP